MQSINKAAIQRAIRVLLLAGALGYLVVLFLRLPTIINQFSWNSDADSAKNLASTIIAGAPGAHIFTQQAGFIWLDWLTGWLPAHVQIWVVIPWLFAATTVALLVWMAKQLGGRDAALLTSVLAIAWSPTLLPGALINTFHGYAWTTIAVFAAAAVGFANSKLGWSAVGLLSGLGSISFATDPIGALCALAALTAVTLLLVATKRSTAGKRTGACVGLSVLGFGAVQLLMHALRFSGGLPGASQQGLPSPASILSHANQLWLGLLDMVNGQSMALGQRVPFLWATAASLLAIALLAVPAWAAVSAVVKRRGELTTVYLVYWATASLILVAALLFTNTALPSTAYDPANEIVFSPTRYMTPIFLAAAAVIPLWAVRFRAGFIAAGVGTYIFAFSSIVGLVVAVAQDDFHPRSADALPELSVYFQSHPLSRGYASYWDAQAVTWNSQGQIPLYAVAEGKDCGTADDTMCFFAYNAISSWFAPAGSPTAVVVDPAVDWVKQPPPASFGAPTSVDYVGRFTVYWFNYDVSTRFVHSCAGRTDHSCG